jgi:hypothetical protein
MTDDEMISSYITCPDCGTLQLPFAEAKRLC